MPFGANGPVRYTSSGMNIVPPWASTAPARGPATRAAMRPPIKNARSVIVPSLRSVGERPQAELLLHDLPQPRQSAWLHDEEEDDEPAEDHELELFLGIRPHGEPEPVRRVGQEDRRQHDEGGAEERAEHAPHPPAHEVLGDCRE